MKFQLFSTSRKYVQLGDDRDNEQQQRLKSRPSRPFYLSLFHTTIQSAILPWILSIFLSLLLLYSHTRPTRSTYLGSYETGFVTEFGLLRSTIRLQKTQFQGAFRLHENGSYYLTSTPGRKRYAGPPDEAVDRAWDQILHGRFSGLSPDEANAMGLNFVPDDYKLGRLYFEPSALHNLHCLNYIRRALDPSYYPNITLTRVPEIPFETSHRMHLDHCVDILRQAIMCHADMTPIPRTWVAAGGFWHADPDQVHTCRDFSRVRKWITERNERWPEPYPSG